MVQVSAPTVSGSEELPGQLAEVYALCKEFPSGISQIARLVWTYPPETVEPGSVTGAEVLIEEPGLLVFKIKEMSITINYRKDGEQHTATVTLSL